MGGLVSKQGGLCLGRRWRERSIMHCIRAIFSAASSTACADSMGIGMGMAIQELLANLLYPSTRISTCGVLVRVCVRACPHLGASELVVFGLLLLLQKINNPAHGLPNVIPRLLALAARSSLRTTSLPCLFSPAPRLKFSTFQTLRLCPFCGL